MIQIQNVVVAVDLGVGAGESARGTYVIVSQTEGRRGNRWNLAWSASLLIAVFVFDFRRKCLCLLGRIVNV